MKTTITLPLMRRDGALTPSSFNADENAVDLVFTTGATVRRAKFSWDDGMQEFDEELIVSANAVRLDRLNTGAPFLDTHSSYSLSSVIGAVVPGSARIVGGQGLARVQLSRAADDAATVQKIADGIIRNVSVGYRIHGVERIEKDGQMPLVRVIDWEPMELSAVPIGADSGAGIRSADDKFPCLVTAEAPRCAPVIAHAIRMRMSKQRHLGRLVHR
jgi:hypothetical protein